MLKTLFTPTGQLTRNEFFKGCLALYIVQCLIFIVSVYGLTQIMTQAWFWGWALVTVFMIYPYHCLYGKRLDELKLSRKWSFLIIGIIILSLLPMHAFAVVIMDMQLRLYAKYDVLKSRAAFGFMLVLLPTVAVIMHIVSLGMGLIFNSWKRSDYKVDNCSTL